MGSGRLEWARLQGTARKTGSPEKFIPVAKLCTPIPEMCALEQSGLARENLDQMVWRKTCENCCRDKKS